MRQDFSKTTEEERVRLFPVILRGHDPAWKEAYRREADFLRRLLGQEHIVRMTHIGSSSVAGLIAKPTVDILLEIVPQVDLQALRERLLDYGYVVNENDFDLLMCIKGYTPRGFEGQAFHLHVREAGDWDELYFRDYLEEHVVAALAYARLKIKLQAQYEYDRDAYTNAKGDFIRQTTALARQAFGGRYWPGK